MNNSINKNKTGMSINMIIGIIFTVITLVLLLFFITAQMKQAQYSQSIIGCNLLFSNIDGKPTYFSGSLNTTNNKLIDEIAKQCPSKKITINDKSINKAAELISDCWRKTATGEDIFGANVKNQKICLYCGEITAENEILDFRAKVNTELKKEKYSNIYSKETGIENFNEFNLQLIPNNLESGKSTTVFYYVYRTDIPKNPGSFSTFVRDEYVSSISKFIGSQSSIFTTANFVFSENVLKTYGGIILTKEIENKKEEDFKQFTNTINKDDCTVIIPLKEFK